MQFSYSVSELVEMCGPARVEGSTSEPVRGVGSLRQARPGDLSFLGSAKYRSLVPACAATAILVPDDFVGRPSEGQVYLRVANPSAALGRFCRHLEAALWPRPTPGAHASAVVDPSARIGDGAIIGPLCVVEAGATIGARCWLEAGVFVGRAVRIGADCRFWPGVKILAECVVGERVLLHAGVVIGSDGFGYESTARGHEKLAQVGNVVVQDDVEIGANTTVDRARFSSTVIAEGTKIDNLVQIGHNVLVGRFCLICAQSGIAGSATIEDQVIMAGQVGVNGHITVGKGSMLSGRTAVYSDMPPGSKVKGDPPLPLHVYQRLTVLKRKLPDLFQRVEILEERLPPAGPRSG